MAFYANKKKNGPASPELLILVPTDLLCRQVGSVVEWLLDSLQEVKSQSKCNSLSVATIAGKLKPKDQNKLLSHSMNVAISTPRWSEFMQTSQITIFVIQDGIQAGVSTSRQRLFFGVSQGDSCRWSRSGSIQNSSVIMKLMIETITVLRSYSPRKDQQTAFKNYCFSFARKLQKHLRLVKLPRSSLT